MEIGHKIAEIRKGKNIPQGKLADILNISQKHLSEIENCKKYPRWDLLVSILKQLDAKLTIESTRTVIEKTQIKL